MLFPSHLIALQNKAEKYMKTYKNNLEPNKKKFTKSSIKYKLSDMERSREIKHIVKRKFSQSWMNLQGVMLSENSQFLKVTFYIIPFV